MFAGSFPDRIGNSDDPDDTDVTVKGITILYPRWHRNDPEPKFTVMMPLRDAAGENFGLMVFAARHCSIAPSKPQREWAGLGPDEQAGIPLNHPQLPGPDRRLRPVPHIELGQDVRHVILHRAFG